MAARAVRDPRAVTPQNWDRDRGLPADGLATGHATRQSTGPRQTQNAHAALPRAKLLLKSRVEGDVSLLERGDDVDQVAQAAAEPVQTSDDERVA